MNCMNAVDCVVSLRCWSLFMSKFLCVFNVSLFSFKRKRVPCGSLRRLTHFLVKYPLKMLCFIVGHIFFTFKNEYYEISVRCFQKNGRFWLSRAECLSPLWLLLFLIPWKRHFRIIRKGVLVCGAKILFNRGSITHSWQPLVKVKYTHSFPSKAIRSITT